MTMDVDDQLKKAGTRLAGLPVPLPEFERVVRRRRRMRVMGTGGAVALLLLIAGVTWWPDRASVTVETRVAHKPATAARTIGLANDGVWPSADRRFTQPQDAAAAFAREVLGWSDVEVVANAFEPESCCPSLTVSGPEGHVFRTLTAPRADRWVLLSIGRGLVTSPAADAATVLGVPRNPRGTAARRWWTLVNGKEISGVQDNLSTPLQVSAAAEDLESAVVIYLDDDGVALGAVGGSFSAGPAATPSNPFQCRDSMGSSSAKFEPDLGTYAAFITDLSGAEISFDVVQWLSGDDAADAYHRDNPDDTGGPPNAYYLLHESRQIRTAPLVGDASVWLVRLGEDGDADLDVGSLEELPAYLERGSPESVYWLTFEDGKVVDICEQYRP